MADSHETPSIYPNLSVPLNFLLSATLLNKEQNFGLNKINEIKNYFVAQIKEK